VAKEPVVRPLFHAENLSRYQRSRHRVSASRSIQTDEEKREAMTNPFENDDAAYLVLVNAKNEHSLWPDSMVVPEGWRIVHGTESRQNCLAYVEDNWTNLGPTAAKSGS
jgi:MbtH protein